MKSLLGGGRKDTSTIRTLDVERKCFEDAENSFGNLADSYIDALTYSSSADFIHPNFNYVKRHFGMTSYQKWHKPNKKWR